MATLTLSEAKSKRTQIKAAATRIRNYVENFDTEQGSRYDITERKQKLADLWNQFDEIQSTIESLENADASITDKQALSEQQQSQRAGFEAAYFALMSKCELILEQFNVPRTQVTGNLQGIHTGNHSRESRIRLPKIDLPQFAGSYEDWYSYQDTFDKLIHNNNSLTEIEKFHYLRSSLKEKAAEIIKSIETTTDNYHVAWAAVKERFDNRRWIVQKHIRAMFEAPAVPKESHMALRELLDTILKHVRALKALKLPTDSWDVLLIHIMVSKLDAATTKAWETSLDSDLPDLKALTDFLSKRCQALEAVNSKANNVQINSSAQKQVSKHKNTSMATVATTNLSCSLCKENHQLYHCEKFVKMPIDERIKLVKKFHICMNCLRSSLHQAKECHSSTCRKCNKRHNTMLHLSTMNDSNQKSISNVESVQSNNSQLPVSTQCVASQLSSSILLSTAVIHIYDSNNQAYPCRVLLDSGSQMNFITQEIVDKLRLEERSLDVSVSGVMQGIIRAKRVVTVCIRSRFNNFRENIECVVLPTITQSLPQQVIPIQNVCIPKNIKLADPNFNIPANIDMLIGAELFWKIMCAGQIKQSKAQPILQKTHFGWVISGPIANFNARSMHVSNFHITLLDDLNYMLKRFWEVEHNIEEPQFSEEEKACERIFVENVKRSEEGRFVVTLPVKRDKLATLGESRDIAMRRFQALEARLISQPNLYKEYKVFMQEYHALGHMREISNDQITDAKNPSFYLPHHAVRNEASTTTKIRVVFDGSCKTTTGISLNDALMVGPTLQEDLFSILTRYRTFKIALSADVSKMYRQVLVHPNQTSLQRILWRQSRDEHVKTFELLTVTYGTAPASFLAIRSLRKLAEEYSEQYPVASKIALRDFYVDDLVSGADTTQMASQIKRELTQLLLAGKFELRKWASNEPSLRDEQGTPDHREFILANDKNYERRTLGIVWDCTSDSFKFSSLASLPPLEKPTKRSILSRIALIFDPLGLLGPVTVLAKIIMQDLWRLKMDWDESIPLDYRTKWKYYENELQDLKRINIPRRVIAIDQPVHLEIHGFSDASEVAYGACIYLRATSANGEHSTRLLCSKSRVAPLKSISLPRLELCAAVLLAQLVNKISKCLTCKIHTVFLWTDSTIVLSWLQSCSRTWATFVSNRVAEIQQLTPIQHWHHIRSKENPADPLSRGVMPNSLTTLRIWWAGPPWLSRDKEEWPSGVPSINTEELPERRAKAPIAIMTTSHELDIFHRYSKWKTLIHVIAYILRFSRNAKGVNGKKSQESSRNFDKIPQPISIAEHNQTVLCLIKIIQNKYFAEELKSLAKHGIVNKNSPILRLSPFVDDSGVLRVGGRLRSSNLSYAAKHPILLPGRHPFSHLIVRHEHERHLHAGAQATLAAVRQVYWLISARNIVRQIVRKCIVCFRSSPKPASAIMGNFPSSRVTPASWPFQKCGMDYAGPLYHKEGARKNTKLIKCYMAIFVCMATKAVHIELAVDLTSEAFLNTFKRFISRRGCPSDVFSDNGLNFVGAERELSELSTLLKEEKTQQQVNDYASNHGIRWHFIPPRAPHHGGLWEAAVKSAKRHLIKIAKDTHLKYEELETLLVQIEAILNSRPITPISPDPKDLMFLTPGHFIIGTPLTAYPEESLEGVPVNRLSKWQHVQQLRQHFWKRWTREYLHQLQQRNKWQVTDSSLQVGQMVILMEDNLPPLSWSLGRIQDTHPGDDGVSRVATVRTAKGVYKRPITRLCLLPIESNKSQD